MKFQQLVFVAAAVLASTAFASPLPSFEEIEKRWSQGQTEQQIHANHHIREASPAWLVDHDADSEASVEFAYAPDKRTLESRSKFSLRRKRSSDSTFVKFKDFVNSFMRSEGKSNLVERRSADEEAPVLKPKKTMRYYFSS